MLTNGTEHELNVMVWLLEVHSSFGVILVTLFADKVNVKILELHTLP